MSQPSADEVRKSCMQTLADTHVVYVEAIRKTFGIDGLKAISNANREHGLNLGEYAIKTGNLRKGDLRSIFEFFDAAYPYFGFDLEVKHIDERTLDLKVTSCPWIESFKARGAGEDICTWVTMIDEGIGQAVDAEVKLTIPMCMMRGDNYCIYRWTKE